MKIQQLRYVVEIVNQHLNVTEAANKLYVSQPGISKQVRLLEEELGLAIFERNGKHIQALTPAGERIVEVARELLVKSQSIKEIANEYTRPNYGVLRIATSNTQAQYALPPVVERFTKSYPNVGLSIQQGSPSQILSALQANQVDLAITTEAHHLFEDLLLLPCYQWNRVIVVRQDHPLAKMQQKLTVAELAKYPLVTYTFGFTGVSELDEAFEQNGVQPNVVLAATDADVIKTYVRLGLGVGIIASMAMTENDKKDLVAIDASHLFRASLTQVAFKPSAFLRGYMYDFINFFAPHLTRTAVERAEQLRDNQAIRKYFSKVQLEVK